MRSNDNHYYPFGMLMALILVILIYVDATALTPGTYYNLSDFGNPDTDFSKPQVKTEIRMQELTLNPDGTFKWRMNDRYGFMYETLEGLYTIADDTLILNSAKKSQVKIKNTRRQKNKDFKKIEIKGESKRKHPLYVTYISELGDTCTIFGKEEVVVPSSSRILQVDDALRIPRTIRDTLRLNAKGDIKIWITEQRTFEDEKWIIKGDSIYTSNINGYMEETPLLIDGNATINSLAPAMFKMNPEDDGYAMLFLKQHNTLYLNEAKENNYHGQGLILHVIINYDGYYLIGYILIDSYTIYPGFVLDNPVRVGRWILYNKNGEEIGIYDYSHHICK